MDCPRCGTPMEGGICPECGFPVNRLTMDEKKCEHHDRKEITR